MNPPHDANRLTTSFRAFLERRRDDLPALRILSDPRSRRPLTPLMMKTLAQALLTEDAAWDEGALWQAHATTSPGRVTGTSAAGRFADLVPLVRFALGHQETLEPFADTLRVRFAAWVARKHGTLTRDQRAWLDLARDHMGRTMRIDAEDLERAPFSKQGGPLRAYRLFGKRWPELLDELNAELGG